MTPTKAASPEPPRQAVEELSGLDDLADALLLLRDRDEAKRFLRDLCTYAELEQLAHRWQIVRLLERKVAYLEIAARIGTSTATVTRVAHWLRHGTGGYQTVLARTLRREKAKKP